MRAALETLFSGLFAIVFGILWLQLFAAFWVPGGFSLLEAELRWVIGLASGAACVLLPLGAAMVMAGFVWTFVRLVHTRILRSLTAQPPIPRARVTRDRSRHRAVSVLSCISDVGRAREL